MRAQMSATGWGTGALNVGIEVIKVLSFLMLLAFAISFITHQSFWQSFNVGFLIFWCGSLLLMLVGFQRDRSAKGPVEIDCGHPPMRWLFILNAVLLPFIILGRSYPLPSNFIGLRIGVAFSFALFYLFQAFGRLQICTEGIWGYNGLLRWQQIKSYQWKDSTLVIFVNAKLPFLGRGALDFPPECTAVIDAILHRQLDESHSSMGDVNE